MIYSASSLLASLVIASLVLLDININSDSSSTVSRSPILGAYAVSLSLTLASKSKSKFMPGFWPRSPPNSPKKGSYGPLVAQSVLAPPYDVDGLGGMTGLERDNGSPVPPEELVMSANAPAGAAAWKTNKRGGAGIGEKGNGRSKFFLRKYGVAMMVAAMVLVAAVIGVFAMMGGAGDEVFAAASI